MQFPCVGCEEAGWWWRCTSGTGVTRDDQGKVVESTGCKLWTALEKDIDDVEKSFSVIVKDIASVEAPVIAAIAEVRKILSEVKIDLPKIKLPTIGRLSLSCKIGSADPCVEISKSLNKGVEEINTLMTALGDQIDTATLAALKAVSASLASIPTRLEAVWANVKKASEAVGKDIATISKEAGAIYIVGERIGWFNVMLTILIENIKTGLGISFEMAMVIATLIIIIPAVGSLVGAISLFGAILGTGRSSVKEVFFG